LKQFGLSVKERIKNKKYFDLVYSRGEVQFSSTNRFKAIFFIDRNPDNIGIKTAFTVSKKSGNAVWRNRIKRLLRESYRLNKKILTELVLEKKLKLILVFSPNTISEDINKQIFLIDVMPDVIDLMNQISKKL
jgi:ribonuclease P protein component